MSKELRNDFQEASSKQLQHTSENSCKSCSNLVNPILCSEESNCPLSDHPSYTKPQTSNKIPEQLIQSDDSKHFQITPKSVHSCLESSDYCHSSVNLNIKAGTKQKLELLDKIQQNPGTHIIPNSEAFNQNTGLISSHRYVASNSNNPGQLDVTQLSHDVHLTPVEASSNFLRNDQVDYNSLSQLYIRDQSSIPLIVPIRGVDEKLTATNLGDVTNLLNQTKINTCSYPPNPSCHPNPTSNSQNDSDSVNNKPPSNFDIHWPISKIMPQVTKEESCFNHILSQQNMDDQQRTNEMAHQGGRRHRIPESTRFPNPDTSENVKTTGCPPWMYITIPKREDAVRIDFKDFWDLAISADSACYFKTKKQIEEIPTIFERLMSQARSTEDLADVDLARKVCEAEDLVPTHPLSFDSILDRNISHTKSDWFEFGSEILDEKMTRYMKYITRIMKVLQPKNGQFTGEQLACLMMSNYVHIFTLDFLTRDYNLAFTAFTYLTVNFPMREKTLWRQLTRNEATVVDMIVHLARQLLSLKLDFASYALLKAIRVFKDYDRSDMPDKHVVESAYLKLHKCVYRIMKARYHDVAVVNRGYGYMETFQTYFRSLMDLMDDLEKLAKMITYISPTRWPAILNIFIRISNVYNINQPDTVPCSFQKQLTMKKPFKDRE